MRRADAAHPARDAALRSYDAVLRKDKEGWLANFADDGWIEDPVGPSMFDQEGKGHHGAEGRAHFWDITIATISRFEFEINDSFACANECVNVGVIHTTLANGYRASCEGVFALHRETTRASCARCGRSGRWTGWPAPCSRRSRPSFHAPQCGTGHL